MSGYLAPNQTITTSETKLGALRVQQSSQGVPVAIVCGTTRVSPNLFWYDNFQATAHTTQSEQGGKGGGGVTTVSTTYTYSVGIQHGLCEGPLFLDGDPPLEGRVVKVWAGKQRGDLQSISEGTAEVFLGTYDQDAWSFLVSAYPAAALAYRGTVYVASSAFPLGGSNSLPNLTYEVRGFSGASFSFGGAYATACTPDANPADVISLLLTNEALGQDFFSAGFPAASISDTSLTDFGAYCMASNRLVSPVYAAQRPMSEILTELALVGNSAVVWSEGKLKLRPYADQAVSHTHYLPGNGDTCTPADPSTYTPDLTVQYTFTYDDFLAPPGTDPVRVRRTRQADAYNMVQVKCLDRGQDYNEYVAEAKDQANIELYGLRPMEPLDLKLVCDPAIARTIAQTILQRALYVRNTYEFSVGWKYARLEPMDIVALDEPLLGLSNTSVRVIAVEENEFGTLTVTAEDLTVGVSTPGDYSTEQAGGTIVNSNQDPGPTATPVVFQPPVELSGVPQVWIGAAGGPDWGGAQVWASDDDATYAQLGTITAPARYGALTSNLPAGSDPDTANTLSVDLSVSGAVLASATPAQADAQQTLSYVGSAGSGELLCYSEANLTAPFSYDLGSYLRRGQRCTVPEAHLVGADFLRLDGAVQKFNVALSQVGSTIYLKLLSFNTQGNGLYTLDAVSPITYTVLPVGVIATNGAVPSEILAGQVLCVPPLSQYSVQGRLTCTGRINCDGRLIIT